MKRKVIQQDDAVIVIYCLHLVPLRASIPLILIGMISCLIVPCCVLSWHGFMNVSGCLFNRPNHQDVTVNQSCWSKNNELVWTCVVIISLSKPAHSDILFLVTQFLKKSKFVLLIQCLTLYIHCLVSVLWTIIYVLLKQDSSHACLYVFLLLSNSSLSMLQNYSGKSIS